jgi:transposase-like protein
MLLVLGLDEATEAVYRAMLVAPQSTVAELCQQTGLSDESMSAALSRLSELALLRPPAEQTDQLRVVPPEIGIEILLARQSAELAAHRERVEAARASAALLIAEYAEIGQPPSSPSTARTPQLVRSCSPARAR